MKRNLLRAVIAAAALSWVVGIAVVPAQATVSVSLSVYQCSGSNCTGVASGGLVSGTIQVQGSATSSFGVKYMRLDATGPGGTVCLGQWNGSSISPPLTWNTTAWPSSPGCTGSSGMTYNGDYSLKLTAYPSSSLESAQSRYFYFGVNNKPSTPSWAGSLSVSGAQQRQPVVTLRWSAIPQPDAREYHFIRTDPNGLQHEYAISASNPGGQGCEQNTSTYTCYDEDFPSSGFGGHYSYYLVAYRFSPSNAASCTLAGRPDCIASSQSGSQAASITEPPKPSPTPTPTKSTGGTVGGGSLGGGSLSGPGTSGAGATPTPSGSKRPTSVLGSGPYDPSDCFTCGSYSKTLPYGQGKVLVPGGQATQPNYALGSPLAQNDPNVLPGTTDDQRRTMVSIAGGMLLMLGAAHMGRALRRSAR